VAIRLKREEMEVALERAFQFARHEGSLPRDWLGRVERIESAPSKTYTAALGAALLAKATDDRVDSLASKGTASERGYSLRSVAEFLASKQSLMGFHLGATGKWPLNNSPFYKNHARIDRFEGIDARARPYYDDLVRYLHELDRISSEQATHALGAFLHRRIAFAEAERMRRKALVSSSAVLSEVIDIARLFVTEDPEGGKRGQAFAAAVLDCAYDDVRLRSINDPNPIDVSAWAVDGMVLAAEVKQLAVDESTALALAKDAAENGCDRALLVALHPDQPHLDREHIRHVALAHHGVLLEACVSVEELVARVLIGSRLPLAEAALRIQEWYAARMAEHGLPVQSQERWANLCSGLRG
jgi:hypothetical protein